MQSRMLVYGEGFTSMRDQDAMQNRPLHVLTTTVYLQQRAVCRLAMVYGERFASIKLHQAIVLIDQSNKMQVNDIL